jgi:regulator of sigma E protease
MVTLFSGILILGVLVFVHEFGHFTVAKLCGVKVLKFSLGFGPKLVSYSWGETEYMISAIPLGGYVQMLGEGGGEEGETAELSEADRLRSFAHKPLHKRIAIVAAGPLMNLALPFLLLPISFMVGVNVPRYLDGPPCAGYVIPGSEAEQIGFQAGDCIVSVNGDQVETWNDSFQTMVSHVGPPLELLIERAGTSVVLKVASARDDLEELSLERLGLMPPRAAVIGSVADNYPAARAGVKPGDRILSINQQPVSSWYDVRPLVLASAGSALQLLLERDGQQLELTMTPEKGETGDGDYIVGVSPEQMVVFKRYSLGKAIEAGYRQTLDLIQLTLVFIQKLFSGQVSAKNIGGPIMIFQVAGQAMQTGFSTVLTFMAFISIQLGILNLLPVPVLDGGHLFFYSFEAIFRRPLSMRVRELLQQFGLVLIVLLMVFAFYNDFVKFQLFEYLFGWLRGG